jgi:hypothetical protein
MRLILLWVATWKNGVMDYAPGWVKQDTAKYPRMISGDSLVFSQDRFGLLALREIYTQARLTP